MKNSSGALFIVGAGPGNPGLITVKGLRALQQADVVLYDALVAQELLAEVKAGCKLVYVGKRKGKKEFPQEEINQLIVFYSRRYTNVVRLKGGDVNVFGRGHEEMEYAINCGVTVEVIPGVSSSLAGPTSAGIPLTRRGINESFWVVTGTTSSGKISKDILLAAQSSATIIVMMGLSHLEEIASIIQDLRSPLEPMAVIQNATLQDEKVITGPAEAIYRLAMAEQIGSPAIIVIGKVVDERICANSKVRELVAVHRMSGNSNAL